MWCQCGIPSLAFHEAEVCEIGPGGGWNALALFMIGRGGIKHIDFIEPTTKGQQDLKWLYQSRKIPSDKYNIYPCVVEDFAENKQYDIVIAEGFLDDMNNQEEIIRKLSSMCRPGGIIVVTCADSVGYFVEIMKRLMAQVLAKDIEDFEEKVEFLTKFFEPQLKTLKGCSRPARDWVLDCIMWSSINNKYSFDLNKALDLLKKEFYVLGSSPNLFTDYSWYQDVWHDTVLEYKKQFSVKRMSLLMAGMRETESQEETVNKLVCFFDDIRDVEFKYEETRDEKYIVAIEDMLCKISPMIKKADNHFFTVFQQIQLSLRDISLNQFDISKYPQFFQAFGRSQQYIAFEKKNLNE